MDSILTSIKKLLGIDESYTQFDADIVMHINSVFLTLYELGVGPSIGFHIEDSGDEWGDYIQGNDVLLGAVKSYMYLKVRLLFDPPQSSAAVELMKEQAKEYEWRMNVLVDPKTTFEGE